MPSWITVKGAYEHNLKHISVKIPKHKLVAITGVSGSGKSSLVFDVLYKEAQRRYLNIFLPSPSLFTNPKVDSITGLSPTIMLSQTPRAVSKRSTIGTLTDIYSLLRILYAKIGLPHCPQCHRPLKMSTVPEMVNTIISLPEGTKLMLLAPVAIKSENWWKPYLKNGFTRIKLEDQIIDLADEIPSIKVQGVDLVVDRLIMKEGMKQRVLDSVELAVKLGEGKVKVYIPPNKEFFFSLKPICPNCNVAFPEITPSLFSFNSPLGACSFCKGTGVIKDQICPQCQGKRLSHLALNVKVGHKDIFTLGEMPLKILQQFFKDLDLDTRQRTIATPIISALQEKIDSLVNVGLEYLELNRTLANLSFGEYKRLLIAQCINQRLTDIVFIFDEPTAGLHSKEIKRLLDNLQRLKEAGNTVIVVEHNLEVIQTADYIIELGPGAGQQGGRVVFEGTTEDFLNSNTLTARYLSNKKGQIEIRKRHKQNSNWLVIKKACVKNLKIENLVFPLGCLSCVYGVSGSGKTTLLMDVLYESLRKGPQGKKKLEGIEVQVMGQISHVVILDTKPILKTKRANVATYTGIFNHIRNLFAQLPEARARGYKPERFSFNSRSGCCEVCQGEGEIKIQMSPLPELYLVCEACNGKRFNPATLEIKFRGKNIAEILEMNIKEALGFFRHIPILTKRLSLLIEVGLGYLLLGQPLAALSGGEISRLKLAKQLLTINKPCLYLFDEPTLGLHFEDVTKLIVLLEQLIEKGHTIILATNHPLLIKSSDYLVEMGPKAGIEGGQVLNVGWNENIRPPL